MRKKTYICDCCNKLTCDYYAEIGWIHINGAIKISVSAGRKKNKKSDRALYYSDALPKGLDFCNIACFVKWLCKQVNSDKPSTEARTVIRNIQELILLGQQAQDTGHILECGTYWIPGQEVNLNER